MYQSLKENLPYIYVEKLIEDITFSVNNKILEKMYSIFRKYICKY